MRVWLEKDSGLLFVVRPWHELAENEKGEYEPVHIGWMFQYSDEPKWLATVDSDFLRDGFIDLGEL